MPTVRPGPRALALLAAASLTGCSFLAVNRQPMAMADPTRPGTPCTPSRAAPILDTALAVTYAAFAVKAGRSWTSPGAAATPLVFGAVFAGSAAFGYAQASRCDDLTAGHQRCLKGDQAACRALAPPFEPALAAGRAPAVPRLCAGDAGCDPGQACRGSACIPAPPAIPPPPAPAPPPEKAAE